MKSAGFYTSNILTQISEESDYRLSVFILDILRHYLSIVTIT